MINMIIIMQKLHFKNNMEFSYLGQRNKEF